jgi:hypothetical protein
MALGEMLDTFFTDEWVRFTRGLAKLDPEQQRLAMLQMGQKIRQPGETATVSIPGWDEVIKLGPRYQPTTAERKTYYDSLRSGTAPAISSEAKAAMDYSMAARERIRTSAQPGYASAFGEVLTAVDNVQDFFSTVATVGRLGIWGVERAFNAIAPGATAALASEAGAAAARAAQAAAFDTFETGLLAAIRRGEPVAAYLLGDELALAGARRAAVELAGEVAYKAAFRTALLGLGSRLVLRALPIVGWVLLASDLLNLLSLLGMLAMPAYAALCQGPAEALAAGVPAAVFKNGLKKETWKMANLNPFSRTARAARAARALGRLPSISNLLEVAQTTENLFGVGITLGGLTGMMMEGAYGIQLAASGQPVALNINSAAGAYNDPSRAIATPGGQGLATLGARLHQLMGDRVSSQSIAELVKNQQAAITLSQAPAILRVQETFDDETHLKVMVAYAAALSTLAPQLRGLDFQALQAEMASVELEAPWPPSVETLQWATAMGHDIESTRRWWWPGGERWCTGADYVEHNYREVIQATRDWFIPHRNTVEGAFYGGLINTITEAVWLMLEDDDEFLKWSLSTDARLLASLCEAGRMVNTLAGEDRLWSLWNLARNRIEKQGDTSLQASEWDKLACQAGVQLITMLPPGSPWPEEWAQWIEQEEAKARANGDLPPSYSKQEWLL